MSRIVYTDEIANDICVKISEGNSLTSICKDPNMPSLPTVYEWLRANESFAKLYARACDDRTEGEIEEIKELELECLREVKECEDPKIANAIVQAYKLRIESRKWVASKMKPKKFGDKLDITSNNETISRTIDIQPVALNSLPIGNVDKQ